MLTHMMRPPQGHRIFDVSSKLEVSHWMKKVYIKLHIRAETRISNVSRIHLSVLGSPEVSTLNPNK